MRNLKLEVSAPARTVALSLYPRVFTTALRSQMKYLTAIMIRNLFFVMVLFIFTSIWRVAYAGRELIAGFTMVQILWYLSFTEVVEMSKSRLMTPIQEEVKEGTIAYNLLRPYDYIWFYLVRGYGESLVALVPMLIVGGVASALLVGPLPGYASNIGPGIVLMLGGLGLHLMLQIIIGLLAFWMEESFPVYLLIQKMVFILGGLFFPIDLFPDWLAGISRNLPFAFITYWPARLTVNFDGGLWLRALAGQIIYFALLALLARALFRAGMKNLESNGG
jgi:ABC-2 type transport system permease protein